MPSPIDLWNSRSPFSLLLLPVVFIIYSLLQLPLDFNSSSQNRIMTPSEWSGRAKDVDKLSKELNTVKHDLREVEQNHEEVRDMVGDLKKRLGKMKERRENRGVRLRKWERMQREREEERKREEENEQRLLLEEQKRQRGVAREGPLSSASLVRATAVTTFAGKQNVVDGAKKVD